MTIQKQLISVSDCAGAINITPKTARNWLSMGRFPIPTVKIGGRRMVRVQDLEAFVAGLVPADALPSQPLELEVQPHSRRPRKIDGDAFGVGHEPTANAPLTPAAPRRRGRPRKTASIGQHKK